MAVAPAFKSIEWGTLVSKPFKNRGPPGRFIQENASSLIIILDPGLENKISCIETRARGWGSPLTCVKNMFCLWLKAVAHSTQTTQHHHHHHHHPHHHHHDQFINLSIYLSIYIYIYTFRWDCTGYLSHQTPLVPGCKIWPLPSVPLPFRQF